MFPPPPSLHLQHECTNIATVNQCGFTWVVYMGCLHGLYNCVMYIVKQTQYIRVKLLPCHHTTVITELITYRYTVYMYAVKTGIISVYCYFCSVNRCNAISGFPTFNINSSY